MEIDIRVSIGWLPKDFDSYALEKLVVSSIIDKLSIVDSAVVLRPEEGLNAEGGVYPDESTRQER